MGPHGDDSQATDRVTALALAAGRGDRAATEAFVRLTRPDVWRSLAFLAGPSYADDLTQETYLRAIPALARFAGRSSARTWLLAIARRVAVDQVRHDCVRPRTAAGVDVADVAPRDRTHRRFEDIVEIRLLLDRLLPERRDALLLTQVLGLTYAEAAEVCGCPVGTIRSRVSRARDDLLAASERGEEIG